MALSDGHGRLIRCCLRTLLRGARRIRQSKAPFLFLQERPRREAYSHLWELQPGSHDAKVLDKLLPPYLRHELSTCELTGQELERIVKGSFRRFQHLGTPNTEAPSDAATTSGAPGSAKGGAGKGSGPGGRRRGGNTNGGEKAPPPMMTPTLDQAVDDLLGLVRLLGEQIRLFECTSVTETHKVRVIATAIPATVAMQAGGGVPGQQEAHFFMYQIRVENRHPRATVQLVGREWVIQDADGQISDSVLKGSIGVVGHEPILRPSSAVAYISGARLPTPYGSMRGSFQMVRRSGGGGKEVPEKFDAMVDPFLLK